MVTNSTTRHFRAMLGCLAIDNFGSGLFLPVTLIYLTRVAGIPLGTAAALLAIGTVAGILMPALAARQVDRWNAQVVVVASQVLQAAGMVAYLFAGGVMPALIGSVLVAAGTQVFYAALGTLTSDTAAEDAKDRAFAHVAMVRSASFGVGGLVGGLLVSLSDPLWLRVAVAVDAGTFLIAAALLAVFVRPHHVKVTAPSDQITKVPAQHILRDHRYLVLLATTFCVMLGVDLFMVAMPVYVDNILHAPGWVIGVNIALVTVLGSTTASWAVKMTDRWKRTTSQSLSAVLLLVWSLGMAALILAPKNLLIPGLVALTVVFAAGNILSGPRLSGMLAVLAPPQRKGQYFAYFQYAFTAAQLVAPLIAGLLAVASWLPWTINAMALICGLALLWWLKNHLPPRVLGGRYTELVTESDSCRTTTANQ